MARPDVYSRKIVDATSAELKERISNYFTLESFKIVGCSREDGFVEHKVFEYLEMARHLVFRATKEAGVYNVHSNIRKWRDKYWYGWMNGFIHEEYPGQRIYVAHSEDLDKWSEPILVADGDAETGMLRTLCALCACGDEMYAIIQTHWSVAHAEDPRIRAQAAEGSARTDTDSVCEDVSIDLWVTRDGVNWHEANRNYIDIFRLSEPPRLTKEGRLLVMAATRDHRPAVVLWPGDELSQTPEVIKIPHLGDPYNYYEGRDEGLLMYGEGSWYYDDEDRIWMWMRDESRLACCLSVAFSEDHGKTWSEAIRSNFPDSKSLPYAGRLADGRLFIVGNSSPVHMDRNLLTLAISEDGAKFDKMYVLIKEPTHQRFKGHLKGDGYQNARCLVENHRLLIAYSLNKEDLEIGVIDTSRI